jgi:shikimate dehydrogenase
MNPLSGSARIAGVVGHPVAQSQAPALHGFWLRRHGIDGVFIPLPTAEGDLETVVLGIQAAKFRGCSVTKPHKQAVIKLCDVLDETAVRIGAVNTLVFEDGIIKGSNTDGFGFAASLAEEGVSIRGARVLLLGAGGAARAVAATLLAGGAAVTVTNRSRERAEDLAMSLSGMDVREWKDRDSSLDGYDLVVNTTSLGMQGQSPLEFDLSTARPDACVVDIIYVPEETPLLADARSRGLRTANGLNMLLHQARPSFKAWFGVEPVVDQELRNHIVSRLTASRK